MSKVKPGEFVDRVRRPNDPRCGTPAGATRHSDRGELPCEACAKAKADYDKDWREQPVNKLRNRLCAKAQARAKTELQRRYPELYRELYVQFRDELFEEHKDLLDK